ncbi:sugar O-acetyltransferase [Streptococcus massiliensis]|uniref:Acetyltransferase n=1 Tax=Streptococcus massiliensis TaxID=313439 RepID=A0A380L1S4_9STRE|nr:sugar O-acetyltransferase [Streptococcus massiliensis]SUN77540.1 acetyltransferase [Streptococcus massiliensis]
MPTEREKMLAGDWYDANYDSELVQKRIAAQDLCFELNQLKPSQIKERQEVLQKLLGQDYQGLVLLSPFTCDYGENINFGKDCFVNINCYFMDGAPISLDNNVFVGPSTGFYTANHPLDYKRRNQGLEKALPIRVGDNVWFGANVNVMPGVTIGSGCVVASGSVVTKDMPDNTLVAGVPAQVVKYIDQEKEIL